MFLFIKYKFNNYYIINCIKMFFFCIIIQLQLINSKLKCLILQKIGKICN